MPQTLTLGQILLALATVAALYSLVQFAVSMRYTGGRHGRGTPGHARGRDARRFTVWSAAAVILLAAAWASPLGRIRLL
jgi:hypothetical protein